MPKMIYICILLIYFKVISKKGGHYCPRLPYIFSREVTLHRVRPTLRYSMAFTMWQCVITEELLYFFSHLDVCSVPRRDEGV